MSEKRARIVRDLRAYGMRGIEHVVRHSDRRDETESVGSNQYQHSHVRVLDRFNLEGCPIRTSEFVESASEDAVREGMNRVLGRIERQETGIILVTYGSRLSRDEEFGARLVKAADKNDVQFIVGATAYNPRIPDERAKLMDMFVIARRENAERKLILMTGKLFKARANQLMIPVPTGLIWVDPMNPAYRALMEREGLMHHVDEKRLRQHQVNNPTEHGTWYILPDPFKDVYRACELVAQWFRETLDPAEVLHRVRTDEQYPRRGYFPCHHSSVFGRSNGPKWYEADPDRLRKWVDSPALYGIYRSGSAFLYGVGETEDEEYVLQNAFPSLFRSHDFELVTSAYASVKRKYETGRWGGPRTHVLPNVRCAERLPNGTICNGKLSATSYREDGHYKYKGAKCQEMGHKDHLPKSAEPLVLQVLAQVFRPETFERAADQIRRTAEDNRHRRAELRARLEGLDEEIEFCVDKEHRGRRTGDPEEEELWIRRRRQAMEERRATDAELKRVEAEDQRVQGLKEEEFDRIRRLAEDVPALLQRARQLDLKNVRRYTEGEQTPAESPPQALLRRIVSRLLRVVRVKHLGRGAYALQIVFSGGGCVTQILVCGGGVRGATRQEGLWAADQLRRGRSATELATQLEAARGRLGRRYWKWRPWDADRVKLAALFETYGRESSVPQGTYELIPGLAKRIGEPEDLVWAVALNGRLGGIVMLDGQLLASPNLHQVEKVFPEYARRRVAAENGWPIEETYTLVRLAKDLSLDLASVRGRAARYGAGIACDSNGRFYSRLSSVSYNVMSAEVALRKAPAACKALPAQHWRTTVDAVKLIPGLTVRGLLRSTQSFRVGKDRWHYMPPEVIERLRLPTLEQAAAAEGLDPNHFVDHRKICALLKAQFGIDLTHCTVSGYGRKAFLRVWVRLPHESKHRRVFVYVPAAVRDSQDPEVARAWLRGAFRNAR